MLEIVENRTSPARIKVFGVGGGGSNAVNRMIQSGLSGVEFWVANTDMQALEQATCVNRLQIGCAVTRGLGAGGDPEIGRLSAEEDRESIAEILRGADMLFITAGMGGGTGTGAAPVVAEVARQLGILTVAIVTKPFNFEGKKKMSRAFAGLAELGRSVDTLIAIPNQKLLNIVEPGTPFRAAMLVADEVLLQATRGISDLITGHGEINLDFADVKSVMRNRGNALLGCGVAEGPDRAVEAAQAAVSSPLLEEVSISGAEALLINVQGGPGMSLHEAADAARFVSERVGEEADVFWGAVVDPALGDEMRVTLIATGFPRTETRTGAPESVSVASALPSPAAPRKVEATVEKRAVAPALPLALNASDLPGSASTSRAPNTSDSSTMPVIPARTISPPAPSIPVAELLSSLDLRSASEVEENPVSASYARPVDLEPMDTQEDGGPDDAAGWSFPREVEEDLFIPAEESELTAAPDRRFDPHTSRDRQAADRSNASRLSPERLIPERLSSDRPSSDRLSSDRLTFDRPSTDRRPKDPFTSDRSTSDRFSSDRLSADRLTSDRLSVDRSVPDRPGGEPYRARRSESELVSRSARLAPNGREEIKGASGPRGFRPSLLREDSGLEPRLGRRYPLDEPTFMRKRMD